MSKPGRNALAQNAARRCQSTSGTARFAVGQTRRFHIRMNGRPCRRCVGSEELLRQGVIDDIIRTRFVAVIADQERLLDEKALLTRPPVVAPKTARSVSLAAVEVAP